MAKGLTRKEKKEFDSLPQWQQARWLREREEKRVHRQEMRRWRRHLAIKNFLIPLIILIVLGGIIAILTVVVPK